MSNLIVYNFINYIHGEKQAEYKHKRALADKVFAQAKKVKHEYHPVTNFTGFMMHVHVSNKMGEKFIIVAENKDVLPEIKEEFKFVKTEDYLNGKY